MTNKRPIGFAEFNFCRELQNKQQGRREERGSKQEKQENYNIIIIYALKF